jgi:hypothetical protein
MQVVARMPPLCPGCAPAVLVGIGYKKASYDAFDDHWHITLVFVTSVTSWDMLLVFLPSADYKVLAERHRNHIMTHHPLSSPGNRLLKGFLWRIWWPMTHNIDICNKGNILRHVTRVILINVAHCDTMWHYMKNKNYAKNAKIGQLGN